MANSTSFRLPDATLRQLADIVADGGYTQTQVVIIAIDRMAREEGDKMGECIMVKEEAGQYTILPDATPEDWLDVRSQAARVERIETLRGWAPYTEAWRVWQEEDAAPVTYFVA